MDADADLEVLVGDAHDVAARDLALERATAYVRAYTRGAGFNPAADAAGVPAPAEDLRVVILDLAARLLLQGVHSRLVVGPLDQAFGVPPGSFTFAELAVLNRYRRRAA